MKGTEERTEESRKVAGKVTRKATTIPATTRPGRQLRREEIRKTEHSSGTSMTDREPNKFADTSTPKHVPWTISAVILTSVPGASRNIPQCTVARAANQPFVEKLGGREISNPLAPTTRKLEETAGCAEAHRSQTQNGSQLHR